MTGDESAVLVQYGAVGLIAILALFAVKVLYNKMSQAYDREKERADRLEAELQKLNEVIRSDYIGTISKASSSINEANRIVSEVLLSIRGKS